MKKVTRANLRGQPLERECYKANTYTQNGVTMCLGLNAEFSDEEIGDISEKCLKCKAYHNSVSDDWLLVAGALLSQKEVTNNE